MSPKKVGSLLAMRSPVGDFLLWVKSDEKRIDTRIPAEGKRDQGKKRMQGKGEALTRTLSLSSHL